METFFFIYGTLFFTISMFLLYENSFYRMKCGETIEKQFDEHLKKKLELCLVFFRKLKKKTFHIFVFLRNFVYLCKKYVNGNKRYN